ncbi:alpha/beta fold hydrolase [Bacillus halotolerans]|uniref:alpha/beta fold hydrolase n=1 Tax=Bacillus halotolerans TaxID=260554 RepID=UPI00292CC644|nr:alpha/beta hydrolase [Bacillus halotolerans]
MNAAWIERTYTVDGCEFHTKHRKGFSGVTIVFEAGYGTSSETWKPLTADIDDEFGIFTYDRAGIGKSGQSKTERTADQKVRELESLLKAAGISPPYLAVSHSYGSVISSLWACKNRQDIIGMVLLDPALGDYGTGGFTFIPEEMHTAYRKQMMLEETHADFSKSLRQFKQQQVHLGNMPLIVLSSGERTEKFASAEEDWRNLHSSILSLSDQSGWIQAKNSSHNIHHDEPHIVHLAIYDVWCAACQQAAPIYQAVN